MSVNGPLRMALRVFGLWFGVSRPVGQVAYAVTGVLLMLLKYFVEAQLILHYAGQFFAPWHFLNPLLSTRMELTRGGPDWLPWAVFVWTLPFLWIAVSMSVRRAADAGMSPWIGLLVLVPIVNLMLMVLFCCLPHQSGEHWSPQQDDLARDSDRGMSAAMAIGASVLLGGVMLLVSVYLLETYGASLFLGTPLLMGSTAAFLYNRSGAA
jgi:uncharacterized membrane protein YhaH (DUF805 family)